MNLSSNINVSNTIKYTHNIKDNKSISSEYNESSFNDIIKEKSYCDEVNDTSFNQLGPTAPSSVNDAWDKAVKETGANGFGKSANGRLTHLSEMLVIHTRQLLLTGHSNVLGSSKESAIESVQEALYNLNNPILPFTTALEERKKEKEFYKSFLKYLKD